jgi:hypothetical protein
VRHVNILLVRYANALLITFSLHIPHFYFYSVVQPYTSSHFHDHRIFIFHWSTFACHQLFPGARSISAINLS